MQVLSRTIAIAAVTTGILTAALFGAVPAHAQCAMMSGGGHGSTASHGDHAARRSSSDKKLRASIERLLSDERGRALLTDAMLDDQALREAFVQRLAMNPKWRAMVSQQLSASAPSHADGSDSRVAPGGTAIAYACPMHSEVTSSGPGSCPKCGMDLVPAKSPREQEAR